MYNLAKILINLCFIRWLDYSIQMLEKQFFGPFSVFYPSFAVLLSLILHNGYFDNYLIRFWWKKNWKYNKTNLENLDFMQLLPFVFIILYGHLNASLLISNGVDVKTVQACLGHAQASTTMNIYAHSFMEAQARAIEAVANSFSFTGGNKYQA